MEQPEDIENIIEYFSDPYFGAGIVSTNDQAGDPVSAPPPIAALYDYPPPPTPVVNPSHQETWKGEFGFEVAFEESTQHTKSCSWTYSAQLQRLYVRDNTVIPFHLRVISYAPFGDALYVSAHLKYSDHQHMTAAVLRCPNHASESHSSNASFPYPEHLIRVEGDPHASYYGEQEKYVRFLLPVPATGDPYGRARLRFMCPNSCPGGMNRRSTDLVLTLENSAGTEVGRFRTPIKICSCPGRDREKEEKKRGGQQLPETLGSGGVVNAYPPTKKRVAKNPYTATVSPSQKKFKVELEMNSEELAVWIRGIADQGNKAYDKFQDSLSAPRPYPSFRPPM